MIIDLDAYREKRAKPIDTVSLLQWYEECEAKAEADKRERIENLMALPSELLQDMLENYILVAHDAEERAEEIADVLNDRERPAN